MISKIKKIFIALLITASILPQFAFAQATDSQTGRSGGSPESSSSCETDDLCQGKDKSGNQYCRISGVCVLVPINAGGIRGASSLFELIAIVLKWMLTLAGIIATIFLIIGGYQYITAAGNEEASEKGKKTLINAVIGIVVIILAFTVITILTSVLSSDPGREFGIRPGVISTDRA